MPQKKKIQVKSLKAAALAFDIPQLACHERVQSEFRVQSESNLSTRLVWDTTTNNPPAADKMDRSKNSKTEESTLSIWILDMDKRGLLVQLPTVHHLSGYYSLHACHPNQL